MSKDDEKMMNDVVNTKLRLNEGWQYHRTSPLMLMGKATIAARAVADSTNM